MLEKLIVSDAGRGQIVSLRLPALTVEAVCQDIQQPGALCAQDGFLYAASVETASIVRIEGADLRATQSYPAGRDIERICLSRDGRRLYALLGGADSLLMLDAEAGYPLMSAQVGVHPRDVALDASGRVLAVAGGASGSVILLEADTLRVLSEWPVGGISCGVRFHGEQLYVLCAAGDYELQTAVGVLTPKRGRYTPWQTLPGLPGGMHVSVHGVYVGHLGGVSLLLERSVRWRWDLSGLPELLFPIGRDVGFVDRLEGRLGVLDGRQPRLIREADVVEDPVCAVYIYR